MPKNAPIVRFEPSQKAMLAMGRKLFVVAAPGLAAVLVHLLMVVLAGPLNELRSIITGWYRVPKDRAE